ncbi:MAG: MoxR family ATPase [Thermoprotei archaeon]|nr:MoxR family ATPase [Thermoprotei archaeon]
MESDIAKRILAAVKRASHEREQVQIVLKGQYLEAYELLKDAETAGLTPAIIGPPGVGKTLLCRYYAMMTGRPFFWVTLDEGTKPSHLIGSFNPAVVLEKGFTIDAFEPGPLTLAMVTGGVFVANELNRASEYVQNVFLEPLEERSYYIPHIGRIKADSSFFFIASMNPAELAGVHRISEALRDRIQVWITLTYPDKDTELEIVRLHCREHYIPDDVLEKIYAIVARTRSHSAIEKPASIRATVSIAKLAAEHMKREGSIDDEELGRIARHVLIGSIKTRPGVKKEEVVNSIIEDVLKAKEAIG